MRRSLLTTFPFSLASLRTPAIWSQSHLLQAAAKRVHVDSSFVSGREVCWVGLNLVSVPHNTALIALADGNTMNYSRSVINNRAMQLARARTSLADPGSARSVIH